MVRSSVNTDMSMVLSLRTGRTERLRRVQVPCGKRVVDSVTVGRHDCVRIR
jgi:hypothetical protein